MDSQKNKQEEKYPVREGSEESSILHDKDPQPKNTYPQKKEGDKQVDIQPEYIDGQPNKKRPD